VLIPIAPIPTFFMDPYTFHREPDGWIESNIRYFVDHFNVISTTDRLALLPKHCMSTWLYDPNPPPLWIYTKAFSAYTALVQLYARSGQLATAEGLCQKGASASRICCFGCQDTENPHHIFVNCGRFKEMRSKQVDSLITSITRRLDDAGLDTLDLTRLMHSVKFLFSDSSIVWPLQSSVYFLGQILKVDALLPPLPSMNPVTRSRLVHNLATDMHLASACLASRIYGDLQKEITKRHVAIYGTRR
jgi:hypothetical protein